MEDSQVLWGPVPEVPSDLVFSSNGRAVFYSYWNNLCVIPKLSEPSKMNSRVAEEDLNGYSFESREISNDGALLVAVLYRELVPPPPQENTSPILDLFIECGDFDSYSEDYDPFLFFGDATPPPLP